MKKERKRSKQGQTNTAITIKAVTFPKKNVGGIRTHNTLSRQSALPAELPRQLSTCKHKNVHVCGVALPCCLFDLACFCLPSLIKTCTCTCIYSVPFQGCQEWCRSSHLSCLSRHSDHVTQSLGGIGTLLGEGGRLSPAGVHNA